MTKETEKSLYKEVFHARAVAAHVESGDCNYNYPNSPNECFIGAMGCTFTTDYRSSRRRMRALDLSRGVIPYGNYSRLGNLT